VQTLTACHSRFKTKTCWLSAVFMTRAGNYQNRRSGSIAAMSRFCFIWKSADYADLRRYYFFICDNPRHLRIKDAFQPARRADVAKRPGFG